MTRIYPGVAESDESEWQELVVRHLGLTEWIRLERRGEDELLGEAARASVQRRGILWPPALHVQGTVYAALGQGGSVLTGEGGDEVLGPRRITPITLLLRKRRRPTRHLVASNVRAVLPASGRAAVRHVELRNGAAWYPWLRPAAARRHHQMMAADEAAEPLFYDAATRWIARRRAWSVMDWNHRLIAAEYGLSALNPLLDPAFLAALARFGGRWGFAGRTATMKALFADVLPLAILSRSTKARFNEIYSGDEIRSFARQWDGSGVDPDMVDPERLREAWLSEEPTFASAPLLHQAWLTTQRTPRSVTR